MMLPLLVFLLGAGGVFGAYLLINHLPGYMARRELDKRLRDVSMPGDSTSTIDSIVKKESQGPLPSLDRVVAKMKAGTWLAELIEQSGTSTTPSAVVVMMIATGTASIFAASTFIRLPFAPPSMEHEKADQHHWEKVDDELSIADRRAGSVDRARDQCHKRTL